MEKLILVRHGKENRRGGLALGDRSEIESFSRKLLDVTGEGKRVCVQTSGARAALETAKIIASTFGVKPEEAKVLYTGDIVVSQVLNEQILGLILGFQDRVDVLILVTHLEAIQDFPPFYGKQLKAEEDFPGGGIEQGHALLIDCQEKTCTHMKP